MTYLPTITAIATFAGAALLTSGCAGSSPAAPAGGPTVWSTATAPDAGPTGHALCARITQQDVEQALHLTVARTSAPTGGDSCQYTAGEGRPTTVVTVQRWSAWLSMQQAGGGSGITGALPELGGEAYQITPAKGVCAAYVRNGAGMFMVSVTLFPGTTEQARAMAVAGVRALLPKLTA